MAIQLGSAYGKVHIDSSGVKRGVDSAKQHMGSLERSAVQLGAKLQSVGRSMTAAFTLPIALLGGKAFQVMKDFDGSLNVLKAVANATNEEMQQMTDLARQLGADLTLPGTSAADAAEAMAELAKAGLSVNQIMNATRGVLQLSAAGQIDNARAAEITANALNVFNLEGEDAVRVADLLAASANASSAEVSEMADSLQMAAAVAAMSNMTIEETVAALSLLANAGIQGSDAGTSLKQMFLALQTPSSAQKKIMTQYGLSIYNAAGQMKSMREIIVEFSSKLSGLNDEQRNYALGVLFGSDAVRAANIVLMQGVDAYDRMFTSVTRTGEASRLAAALMEGLPGVIENIKSAFETAAIAAIEPFKDEIIAVGNAIAKTMNWFSNLPAPVRKVIVVLVLLLAVVGPLLILLGSIVPMLGLVTRSMNPFSGGIIGLIFSFVKLVAAAAIVIKVLTFLGISTGPVGAAILGLNGAIAGTATTIWGALLPAIGALFSALAPILLILAAIAIAVGILYLAWKFNIFGMRDIINTAIGVMKRFWQAFMAFLHGDTETGLAIITELFSNFQKNMAGLFDFSGFQTAWSNFMNFMRTALSNVVSFISRSFTNIDWSQIGKFITFGIANGMLLGIPGLVLAAAKAGEAALAQIKKTLGISSPSKKAFELGASTVQGYMLGLRTLDPNAVAGMLARPITNSNSQQQTIIQNFASGLTTQQVRGMIAENNEQLVNSIIGALGGG